MQKVVLLIVGATWLVVLLPPLLRARGESRPTSSVDHFRRNLAVLQQTAPPRINPLQSLGRPLAGGKQGLANSYARAALKRTPTDPRLRRSDVPLARREMDPTRPGQQVRSAQHQGPAIVANASAPRRHSEDATAPLQRRHETRPISRHEVMRQRREQTVRLLFVASITIGVIALLAKSPALMYLCALNVLALFAYCAKLLRMRREAELYAAQGYQQYYA